MTTSSRDLVVVGASAGGIEALRIFVGALPKTLPAAVLIVLHLPAGGTSALAAILDRACALPVRPASSGREIKPGEVSVAVPDHHLLVVDEHIELSRGPTENGLRPAIDALFRSAALVGGPRTVGVVLSGNLDDGAAGLAAVVRRGGRALVQDPHEALYPGMPSAALRRVPFATVLSAAELGGKVAQWADQPAEIREGGPTAPALAVSPSFEANLAYEVAIARDGVADVSAVDTVATPSEFSCPDCGGNLMDVAGDERRFRCHVGHGWTLQALYADKDGKVEEALWVALRVLEEKAKISNRLHTDIAGLGAGSTERMRRRYRDDRDQAAQAATVIRRLLLSGPAALADDAPLADGA